MKNIGCKLNILLTLLIVQTGYALENKKASHEDHGSYQFHYKDIRNFKKVLSIAENRGDVLSAVHSYFANGSEGMKTWVERYDTKPELIAKAIKYFPEYYQYLAQLESKLIKLEGQISKGLDGLKELYPSEFVHMPPIYYFILFSGGGSVEMTANMISLDYFGRHEKLNEKEFDRVGGLFPKGKLALVNVDLVPQVVVHEMAHLLQAYQQGEVGYVSIYEEGKQTMLAYAIREGGADFLTFLGAGLIDKNRHKYGDKHEQELWQLFKPLIADNINDHPGWFFGKNDEHPDWPWQVGYYLGFKIVEYYYDTAEDKDAALHLIFNSNKQSEFERFIAKYEDKWQ